MAQAEEEVVEALEVFVDLERSFYQGGETARGTVRLVTSDQAVQILRVRVSVEEWADENRESSERQLSGEDGLLANSTTEYRFEVLIPTEGEEGNLWSVNAMVDLANEDAYQGDVDFEWLPPGVPALYVELAREGYRGGDTAAGTVYLFGGTEDLSVARVTATVSPLDELAPPGSGQVLSEATILPAGAVLQYGFGLPVPADADLSRSWCVEAAAELVGAEPLEDSEGFHLLPPGGIGVVFAALQEVAPFNRSAITREGEQLIMDFSPPEYLKRTLDGVRLLLSEDHRGVWGKLEIDPQEKNLLEHLKVLVMGDHERVRHDLNFPPSMLTTDEAGAPSRAVVEVLEKLLEPYL